MKYNWQIYSHFGTVKAKSLVEAMKKAIDCYFDDDKDRTNERIDIHVKRAN